MAETLSSETGVVLFVDDDPDVLTAARVLLERNGFRMQAAQSPTEAWAHLSGPSPDVILLDLNFTRGAVSGAEGFRWLAEVRAHDPDAVVVVVTGHSGINIAVSAMKAGASDFVMKPWNNARFLEVVRGAQAVARQRRASGAPPLADEDLILIGESVAIQRIGDLIERVAPTRAAVLVRGEAGTGKSLAARRLHARSGRPGAFVRVDARALGADSGEVLAQAARAAQGGALFLDEVAGLPMAAQAEVLALLDRGDDVRLISATRAAGREIPGLRDDLASQLATVELNLPPLAERGDDVVLLANHFARLFARRYDRPLRTLDQAAAADLRQRPPPGEVRGLRQAAERAVVLGGEGALSAADFAPSALADVAPARTPDLNLARSERAIVEAALKRHAHNVSQAARELGLTRAALYRRMVKHGL